MNLFLHAYTMLAIHIPGLHCFPRETEIFNTMYKHILFLRVHRASRFQKCQKRLLGGDIRRIHATPPRAQGLLTEVWQRRKRQK